MRGKGLWAGFAALTVVVLLAAPAAADAPVNPQTDITGIEATSSDGASVSYPESGKVADGCDLASPHTFPVGLTTVSCTAPDASGAPQPISFTVTVVDTTKPVLGPLPAPGPVEATSSAGAVVSFTVPTATDLFPVTVGCDRSSSDPFPVGGTPVKCTATDANGNSSEGTFTVSVVDTTKPVLGPLPAPGPVEATSSSGAVVSFDVPTATDLFPVTVGCDHSSSDPFPVGVMAVKCTATDANGNSNSGTFTVTVRDTTKPVLGPLPAPAPVEATSSAGAVVSFAIPTATDLFPVTVGCDHSSSDPFPVGVMAVKCTATDANGNSSSGTFTVTVRDTTKPVLGPLPAPAPVEATSSAGAVVTFTVPTATDLFAVTLSCDHHSGDKFPVGATTVKCTATDTNANSSSGTFTVTVTDKTPPVIAVPAPIVTAAGSSSGAVVFYAATALDLVDGAVTPTCLPASGSLFAVGVTTITCNAKDKATPPNAAAPKTFTVTVTAPPASGGSSPPPSTTTTAPFTPPVVKKPQTVSSFAVTPGNQRAVVVWKLPAGNGLHVELVRTIAGGTPKTVYTGAALTFADTHLQNGSNYSYSIVVVDADGNRSDSLSRIVTPSARLLISPAAGARVTSPPTLVWVPAPKATYYNVQLFRNGQKILSIWPGSRRLTLKAHWVFNGGSFSLSPGLYRWFVWPGYGPHRDRKYGSLLGSSTFQLAG